MKRLALIAFGLAVSSCRTASPVSAVAADVPFSTPKSEILCQLPGGEATTVYGNFKSRMIFRARMTSEDSMSSAYLVMIDMHKKKNAPKLGSSNRKAITAVQGEDGESIFRLRRKNNAPCDYEIHGKPQLAGKFGLSVASACQHEASVVNETFALECEARALIGEQPRPDVTAPSPEETAKMLREIAENAQVGNGPNPTIEPAGALNTQEAVLASLNKMLTEKDEDGEFRFCGYESEDGETNLFDTPEKALARLDEMTKDWSLATEGDVTAARMRKLFETGQLKALALLSGGDGSRTCSVDEVVAVTVADELLFIDYDTGD